MLGIPTRVRWRVNVVDYGPVKIDIVVDVRYLGDGLLIEVGRVQVLVLDLVGEHLAVLVLGRLGLVRVI